MKTKNIIYDLAVMVFISCVFVSCSDNCDYDLVKVGNNDDDNKACVLTDSINLTTGLEPNGEILDQGKGVVDSFWRVINNPPLVNCNNDIKSTLNGDAYVINYADFDDDYWVNQTGAGTLAPFDLGDGGHFGCNNPVGANGQKVPYIFERSFCVLQDTQVDFDFTFRGDDQVYFELIDNATNMVISTSSTYIWSTANPDAEEWQENGLSLSAGSYSIRGYDINTDSVVLGLSLKGSLTTTNGEDAISDNQDGCCENNTISILTIEDADCDGEFDLGDEVGQGWEFDIIDSSGNLVTTGVTNDDGNFILPGVADGTYTIKFKNQSGWQLQDNDLESQTITLRGDEVSILTYFICQE